jgi:hypothetical protein
MICCWVALKRRAQDRCTGEGANRRDLAPPPGCNPPAFELLKLVWVSSAERRLDAYPDTPQSCGYEAATRV